MPFTVIDRPAPNDRSQSEAVVRIGTPKDRFWPTVAGRATVVNGPQTATHRAVGTSPLIKSLIAIVKLTKFSQNE